MSVENLTPDSIIHQQLQGQWQKLLAMALYKTVGVDKPVVIKIPDMDKITDEGLVLLTWGHFDSIELRLVTREQAEKLAEHDKTLHGST